MPATLADGLIENADAAVVFAQAVRQTHARRTNKQSNQRKIDIDLALMRLKEAMAPLRTEIGRFPYGPQTGVAERNRQKIRDASERIQRERRKLFKMKKP